MFEFKVLLSDLIKAFKLGKASLGSKTSEAILQKASLIADKDSGFLTIRMSNEFSMTEIIVKSEIEKSGSLCIDACMFQVLSTYANKKLEMLTFKQKCNDNGEPLPMFSVKGESNETKDFSFTSNGDYPDTIELEGYKPVNLKCFIDALMLCKSGVSTDNKSKELRCYQIDTEGKQIITGNGVQFTQINNLELGGVATLIEEKVITSHISILKELSTYSDTELVFGKISGFRSKEAGIALTIMGFNGTELKDIVNLFETTNTLNPICILELDTKEFNKALEIAKIYEKKAIENFAASYTSVQVTEEDISFSLDIPGVASNKKELPITKFSGKIPKIFKFKVSKLLDFTSKIKSGFITLKLYEDRKPLVVKVDEYPNFTYIQAL